MFFKPYVEKLETHLLESWLVDGKSPQNVFKLLEMVATEPTACFDQQVVLLEDFIKIYNQMYTGHASLLEIMTSCCGGENRLAFLLGTVRKHLRASAEVTELETLLLEKWREENLRPEAVVSLLDLDRTVDGLTSRTWGRS